MSKSSPESPAKEQPGEQKDEVALVVAECKRLAEFVGNYDGAFMPMVDLENALLDAARLLSK